MRKGPPILIYPDRCTGCLICELRCSLRFEKAFNPQASSIQIRGWGEGYGIFFTEQCDNCGICARFCPYDALVWLKGGA